MRPPAVEAIDARFEDIVGPSAAEPPGLEIGRSREGRPILAHRFGSGPRRISLIGGCHADEPVGPRLLGRLASALAAMAPTDPLLRRFEWWVLPHVNPDGAARNAAWQHAGAAAYRLGEYLADRVRELPGDDIEFGFPRSADDRGARPEPTAAARWWSTAGGPFALHATLHGMAFAGGPWFLVEPAWVDRTGALREWCRRRTTALGYVLHDVERKGEKGFHRIERGFATRPSSTAMRDHFLGLGDSDTAARFRPSSMEHVRALGGDPLTLVSEMPLFLLPGVGERPGPPDPALERWRERIDRWSARLGPDCEAGEDGVEQIDAEADALGLLPMPVADQMRLQWAMLSAALATVSSR